MLLALLNIEHHRKKKGGEISPQLKEKKNYEFSQFF